MLHPILTDDEIAALLKTCAVPRGPAGMFDRAIFLGRRDEVVLRLLLDTGVRVSELCGLALTDVHLDRELAYVTPPPSSAPTTPTDVSVWEIGCEPSRRVDDGAPAHGAGQLSNMAR